jgi:hypothetical protein
LHYLGRLREEEGITSCYIFKSVHDDDATLEFHHYPFSLYDIVQTILLKKLTTKEMTSTFLTSFDVLQEHYDNKIGLILLSKTVHELFHAGQIKIPVTHTFGNYEEFYKEYKEYMTPEILNKYDSLKKESKDLKAIVEFNKACLTYKPAGIKNPSTDNLLK